MADAKRLLALLQPQEKLSKANCPTTDAAAADVACFILQIIDAHYGIVMSKHHICRTSQQIHVSTPTKPLGCNQVNTQVSSWH